MNKKNKLIEDEFTDASKFDFSTSFFICRKNGMNQNLTLQYFLYYFFPNDNVCDIYSVMFVAPKLKRKKMIWTYICRLAFLPHHCYYNYGYLTISERRKHGFLVKSLIS